MTQPISNHPTYQFYEKSPDTWLNHKFRVFSGASLALGGASALLTIGAPRWLPLTVLATGLWILSPLISLSSKQHDMGGPTNQIQSSWKMVAMALTVAVLAFSIFFGTKLAGSNSSTDILPLATANPDRTLAMTDVTVLAMSNTLKEINSNSIDVINQRGRTWARFFGKNESFVELLKQDNKVVQAMGTTHIELAAHLRAIQKILLDNHIGCRRENRLTEASEYLFRRPREEKYGFPSLSNVILYNPNWLKGNTIGQGTQTQLLLACKSGSFGIQPDIFIQDMDEPWPPLKGAWSGNVEIINPFSGVRLTVGDGVIDYIQNYGFYEGRGDDGNNPYRVDPIDIVAVLTGKSPSSIREAISK